MKVKIYLRATCKIWLNLILITFIMLEFGSIYVKHARIENYINDSNYA